MSLPHHRLDRDSDIIRLYRDDDAQLPGLCVTPMRTQRLRSTGVESVLRAVIID